MNKELIEKAIKALEDINNSVSMSEILNPDKTIKDQDKLNCMGIYNAAIEELNKELNLEDLKMSSIVIEFKTDNDAFHNDFDHELHYVLLEIGIKLRGQGDGEYKIKDSYGNTIGTAKKITGE